MKIVCDACQAKYSISDDKVQGKVFKIRCKKCSNIIVVRGGAGAAEPAAAPAQEKETRVYDYGYEGGDQPPAGDESVWHVVINQDQVGPMTAAEVQQRFSAGEIDGETYAWREGFADWLPLAQVDTFAAFVASGTTTAAVSHGGGAAAVASMFGGGGNEEAGTVRSDPGDLFATASATARHGDDDGGDLFGSKPASVSAAQQKEAANSKLRGERNENSVLFSLNNLAQLASDKPAKAAASPSASAMSAGHATGQAGGEGSGLIDIRSMANAYLGGGGGAVKPATSSAIGSIDDLPVFGGGGFSEPAVIVPTARAQSNSKLMYVLIGSVGLLAVAAVILVVVMLSGKKDSDSDKVASSALPTDKVENADKADPAKADPAKPDPAKAEPATPDPAKADPAKPDPAKPDPAKPDTTTVKKPDPTVHKTTVRKDTHKDPTTTTVASKDPPKAKDPAPSGGCDEVSCVLSNYEGTCCAKFRKGPAPKNNPSLQIGEKPKSDTPEALDRSMISAGVAAIKGRANACGDRSPKKGTVKVSVKVSPDGSISSVTVKETPDAGLGSCVASAMQKAHFAKTQNGGSFGFPFVFQ